MVLAIIIGIRSTVFIFCVRQICFTTESHLCQQGYHVYDGIKFKLFLNKTQ
jgi:hypothetical protein